MVLFINFMILLFIQDSPYYLMAIHLFEVVKEIKLILLPIMVVFFLIAEFFPYLIAIIQVSTYLLESKY